MAVLEIETTNLEIDPTTTSEGRLFDLPPATDTPTLPTVASAFLMEQCIRDQLPVVWEAHASLKKLREARDLLETAASCSSLVGEDAAEEARYEAIDQGSVWRSKTDAIVTKITQQFPNQLLAGAVFDTDEVMHLTDSHKVFQINSNGDVWAFSSAITQGELNAGVKVASEEMWEELLFKIIVESGK